jgi:two-component system, NtrC family, sensor histidine kinase KinB
MRNLRAKLLLGFGGLMVLLLIVSALSIGVISWYSHAIEQVLHENYRSVLYGQKMLDGLEQLTADGQAAAFADRERDQAFEEHARAARKLFQDNLEDEHRNLTLPGEADAEANVRLQWETYQERLADVLQAGESDAQRRSRYQAMLAQRDGVKAGVQHIIDMNLENMVSVNGHAKAWASWTKTALYAFLGAGVLLGTILILLVGRWILQPLRTFTRSVREIEAGNLNLVVPVRSQDEVGQLAEAFNSMAAKLRAFRETDQAKLLRTQQTTQLAIDSLPDAVAVMNPDGMVEMANGAAARLFGIKPERSVQEFAQGWLTELFRAVRDQQRAYEPQGYQNALQVFDKGTEKFFLPQGVPIKDAAGRLVGVTLVLIDVTRLRQIDEVKSSLVSTVSHELRTPLTSVRLANHLLLSDRIGTLTPKQTEVVMESRDNADRLQKIIENLLDMSRIEAGDSALEVAPLAPHKLVTEAVDQVRGTAQDKGVELKVDVPVDMPQVRADRARVSHVLLNLLNNALRYTAAGGSILVAANPKGDAIEFSVNDTGQGIAKVYQARIFERFYRAPGQNSGGVGLGLAIAREIVRAHGGTIHVESQEGKGTTFFFTLPKAIQEVQEQEVGR